MSVTPDIFGATDRDYTIECKTDALAPDFQAGDTLVVRPQKTAEPGQVVVSLVDDEARLGCFWPQMEGRVIGLVVGMYRSVT